MPEKSSKFLADLPWERDFFLRALIRELVETLENVVGIKEASGFISLVGQRIGEIMNRDYRSALGVEELSRKDVAEVLVDLKQRIQGDFRVVEQDDDVIALENRTCPFGEFVNGRPSLCMMTSNVFGVIAAENLGYAGVELTDTIAKGDVGCKVKIHLSETSDRPSASIREYYRAAESGDGE